MFRSSILISSPGKYFKEIRRWKKRVPRPQPPPIAVNPNLYDEPSPSFVFPPLSSFRTTETDPRKMDQSHLGRFYNVSQDFYGMMTEVKCYPKEFRKNAETFGEQCVLVRKPFLDVKRCIEGTDFKKPVVRYVLYGKPGTGKSLTMCCLMHYGYNDKYVLVNVPWAPLWSRFHKEVVQSTGRPGFFDHTVNATTWLSHFKIQNSQLIADLQLKTQKTYKWSNREETTEGSNLMEIVEHGISRPAHASECIYALISDIKVLSTNNRCKTMVLIDGINAFYYECVKIKRPDRSLVPPNVITAFEAFKLAIKPDWCGGVVICTVDQGAGQFKESDLPRYLLTKEGWEDLDPFVPVLVDAYSPQEVQTTIDYFLERRWLQHPDAGSEQGRKELEELSTRNPLLLMELCNYR